MGDVFGQSLSTPIDTFHGVPADASDCENAASTPARPGKMSNKAAEKAAKDYMKLHDGN